jgi:beta-N-acetylhexosaminidase
VNSPAKELRIRVAQLMLVTLEGLLKPSQEDIQLLQQCPPGGVIIPSLSSPRDASTYIATLRGLPIEAKAGIPLLIGANVYNLPRDPGLPTSEFAPLPSLLSIAAASDLEATRRLGQVLADQLAAMGFNLNLGPALDLAPKLPEAVGSIQCLGSDARAAADAGGVLVETLTAGHILAMPTGFPGGGANRVGSSPGTLLTPGPRLAQEDLLPYAKAIEAGAPLIHVANTLVPTIDAESRPASLSSTVMRDLLRGKLHFEGVVVAGPMDSPDIERQRPSFQAAIEALNAGADMIFWSKPSAHVSQAVEGIARAVEKGDLAKARVDEAVERVLALKRDHELLKRGHPRAGKAGRDIPKLAYPKEAYEVERRAVTLVRNCDNVLPLTKTASVPLGVTGTVGVEELAKALEKPLKQVALQPITTARHLGRIEDFEIARLTQRVQGFRTAVCVFASNQKPQGEIRLIRALKDKGTRVVVVLVGYPRDVAQLVDADAIVLVYCEAATCRSSMQAVADVLLGEGPLAVLPAMRELKTQVGKAEAFNAEDVVRTPSGKLPVTIAAPFVAGFTLSYAPTSAIRKAEWDFGDGKKSGQMQAEHAYETAGQYTATLTVTDKRGAVTAGEFPVIVE